jgi:hypothetical protein
MAALGVITEGWASENRAITFARIADSIRTAGLVDLSAQLFLEANEVAESIGDIDARSEVLSLIAMDEDEAAEPNPDAGTLENNMP